MRYWIKIIQLIDGSIKYYFFVQITQILRKLEVYENDPTVKLLILKVKKKPYH